MMRRTIAVMLVGVAGLACGCSKGGANGAGGFQMPPTPVEVASVQQSTVSDRFEAVGTLEADEEIRVVAEEACGAETCLRVVRQYDADQQAIRDSVAAQVKADVQAKGGDPNLVDVTGMDIKHEDTLLIDPATMEYHGANFVQNATVQVTGPEGQLQVAFKLERQSTYAY